MWSVKYVCGVRSGDMECGCGMRSAECGIERWPHLSGVAETVDKFY